MTLMTLITIAIIASLATWQAIEVWHHSHLLAGLRARADLLDGFFGQLLGCPFCLAPWVSAICLACITLGTWLRDDQGRFLNAVGFVIIFPFLVLATARIANLLNDAFHDKCRTPRENRLPGLGDGSDDDEEATG